MNWINAFKMSFSHSPLQTDRFLLWKHLLTIFAASIILHPPIAFTQFQIPADHLIPPPPPPPSPSPSSVPLLPIPQALKHNRPFDYSQRFEARPIPLSKDVIPSPAGVDDQTGLVTRIARWFGFTGSPQEQQLLAASSLKHSAYTYPKPQEQFPHNPKANCNLCNKYPWIPMLPLSVQYPPTQQQYQAYQQANWNQQHAQASKHAPAFLPVAQTQQQAALKQRAVHLNFPQGYFGEIAKFKAGDKFQSKDTPYAVSPQSSVSGNALPPVFNAQPFRSTSTTTTTTFATSTEQQLPTTNLAHFAENIGSHSELNPDHIIPTQIPSTVPSSSQSSSNVEIIKSQQLADYVSSIEYPATLIQSQIFDVQTQMPPNHKPESEVSTNTVRYQHDVVQSYTNTHIPASQLLTDLNSFAAPTKSEASTIKPAPYKDAYNHQQQLNSNQSVDNFPSASSHNNLNLNLFHLQSNELYTTTEFSTEAPIQTNTFFITEKTHQPSPPTPIFVQSIEIKEGHETFQLSTKDRGTPKRLLDSPIQHLSNGSPRPFTRDPVQLDFRLGQQFQQHSPVQFATTEAPWMPTVTHPLQLTVSSAQPTPTSTYGAIDASGQFAGISPPLPLPVVASTVQQIIVPYTTKSHPRPFEPARNKVEITTAPQDKEHHRLPNIDLHEQQESMVVLSTATEIPRPPRPSIPASTAQTSSTKYITKVLASNLRELLRREQSVDLKKLQKNIDDWTEQEYTSLSHRPSTPTIRGRSKHIPAEYLTTTTTTPIPLTKIFKTAQNSDSTALSTSINNLQSVKVPYRGTKRFEYPPIEQNLITDNDIAVTQATTTTTTTPTTATKSSIYKTLDKYTTPIYVRPQPTQSPPEVLWQKAKILISPETKEKVYVVTPQPRFLPQPFVATTMTTPTSVEKDSVVQHKSGRFQVRPTPGKGSNSTTNSTIISNSSYPFGLTGLSAFVSAEPVEIIHGNSKVVTTITPTGKPEEDSDHSVTLSRSIRTDYVTIKRNHTKPTMAPSPR